MAKLRLSTFLQKTKCVAWRSTASAIWISVILYLLGIEDLAKPTLDAFWSGLMAALERLSLAPPEPAMFKFVAKVSWAFLLSGMTFPGLVGFSLYCLLFPIVLLFLYVIRRLLYRTGSKPSTAASPPPRHPLRFRRLLLAALIVWFMLYSQSGVRLQILLGAALFGALFVAVAARAVLETRPRNPDEIVYFARLEKFARDVRELAQDNEPQSRGEVEGGRLVYEPLSRLVLRLAILLKGSRARVRIAAFVLVEYLFGLLALAALGTFFWALLLRAALTPDAPPLSTLVPFVASHFLPAVPVPVLPVATPSWAHIGPSATFWFLFVLYIGPAASLIPKRQEAVGLRAAPVYRAIRRDSIAIRKLLRGRERRFKDDDTESETA